MSRYDDEVFRLLCNTLGGGGPPGTFVHRTELNARLLPAMTALAQVESVLPAFDHALAVRYREGVAKEIRAVSAVRLETNRRRNRAIRKDLLELGRQAAAERFVFAALKGGAWALEEGEDAAAWRWMIDLDVLVDAPSFDRMPSILERLGYQRISDATRYNDNFHLAPYAKPNGLVTVEVHRHLGWRHELLPPDVVFAASRPAADGLVLPASWCRAYHAMIHWQFQDLGVTRATIALKEMVDVDRFLRRADVDWAALVAQARSVNALKACEAAIALTSALFSSPCPATIPITEFGRRHVALALTRKASPWRTWLAREKWRAGTLWRCEKIAYRAALRGAGPHGVRAAVWLARLVRSPGLLVRALGLFWQAAQMLVSLRRGDQP